MELSLIFQTLFIEVNPVPVKESLYFMGMIEDKTVRLPLCPLADSSRATLINVLRQYGLLRRQP
jgi:4-hydroxy-tetrahydrodipicolinate synthase